MIPFVEVNDGKLQPFCRLRLYLMFASSEDAGNIQPSAF